MQNKQHQATDLNDRLSPFRIHWKFIVSVGLICVTALVLTVRPLLGGGDDAHHRVFGAGKTMLQGGTGGNAPTPVLTLLAFDAASDGGDLECMALAPATSSGAGSGNFTVNAMYVTGKVNSVEVNGRTATLRGTATVTGLGAGTNLPFEFCVAAGGPGTAAKLSVSGLTFPEILLEGRFTVE